MKNPWSKWVNTFPNNPTQTNRLRFQKQPGGEIKNSFTDARDAWDKRQSTFADSLNRFKGYPNA